MAIDKKASRLRRSRQTRLKIRELRVGRLSVFRSNTHIYANIISPDGDKVLVSASTLEAEVRSELAGKTGAGGNVAAASLVGKRVAEIARISVTNVAEIPGVEGSCHTLSRVSTNDVV